MKRIILAMFLLPLIFIACNRAGEKSADKLSEVTIDEIPRESGVNTSEESAADADAMANAVVEADKGIAAFTPPKQGESRVETPIPSPTPVTNIDWDKKIIKTAYVKLEVKSYENYSQKVRNTIKKYGGYIAKEDNSNTDDRSEAIMSIRVPVEFFEPLINELPSEDAKQLERNINTEEVTGQIIDTKARLETRKATRMKYLEFLKQANKVEDVLKVQAEVNDIQEDIESAEGRLAQLTNEARYSTINLTFFEPKNGFVYNDKPAYGNRIVGAFANGGKWFADLFVGLLSIWPLYLFVFIGYIIFKKVRKPRVIKKFE